MKRFWTEVTVEDGPEGYCLRLDLRPLRTPVRALLVVPTRALADGIAAEWREAGEEFQPRTMVLTGLANAAVDRVAEDPERFIADLARYGESDLLCYRAEHPDRLRARQAGSWDPILDWARRRYDVEFAVTEGVGFVPQPEATIARLRTTVAAFDPFRLAGLSPLVTIGGSLVTALGVVEGELDPEAGWSVVSLEDEWQLENWGEDGDARALLDGRKRDFLAAARFVSLRG